MGESPRTDHGRDVIQESSHEQRAPTSRPTSVVGRGPSSAPARGAASMMACAVGSVALVAAMSADPAVGDRQREGKSLREPGYVVPESPRVRRHVDREHPVHAARVEVTSMLLRLAGPIHEAVFPPDGSARAIGRRRHVPAGASHDDSRLGVVREAAPSASAASWACERPDAQADGDHRKNECSPCDHAVNPAMYAATVDTSTRSQLNLNRAEIAECGLRQRL